MTTKKVVVVIKDGVILDVYSGTPTEIVVVDLNRLEHESIPDRAFYSNVTESFHKLPRKLQHLLKLGPKDWSPHERD